MPDIRYIAFAVISATVLFGTVYSVIHNTYLDTSDPLITHLPHPLGSSHYFANKANLLNTYFIKKTWGWTTAAFLYLWFTSPLNTRTPGRIFKWAAETAIWLIFTSWFFGPGLVERVNLATGAECILSLPAGDHVLVPAQYCLSRSFISPITHPDLFTASSILPSEWKTIPRLRKGHDISGHIFLLTMSVLFLADQLRYSFRAAQRSTWHTWAIGANLVLISVWIFGSYTTSLYFHSPYEKFTAYLLGVACFAITQVQDIRTALTGLRSSKELHRN